MSLGCGGSVLRAQVLHVRRHEALLPRGVRRQRAVLLAEAHGPEVGALGLCDVPANPGVVSMNVGAPTLE